MNDPIIIRSRLVASILQVLEEHAVPDWIGTHIIPVLEWWESGAAVETTAEGGFLMVGIDPNTNHVVVNLDRDRTGHITFSPEQARALAELLVKKADDIEQLIELLDKDGG